MRFDAEPVVVYGMRVPNQEVASLVKKVVIISTIAALVVIALTVLNFTIFRSRTTDVQSIITCLVGLIIPVLGFIGAKARSRGLVGIFCSFSLGCGLFNLISYIVLMSGAALLDKYLDECKPDGTVIIDGVVDYDLCSDFTHDNIRNIYIIASCVSLPVIILQCLGGWYGNSLYAKMATTAVITYETPAYPQGQVYAAPAPAVVVASPVVTVPYQPSAPPVNGRPNTLYPSV